MWVMVSVLVSVTLSVMVLLESAAVAVVLTACAVFVVVTALELFLAVQEMVSVKIVSVSDSVLVLVSVESDALIDLGEIEWRNSWGQKVVVDDFDLRSCRSTNPPHQISQGDWNPPSIYQKLHSFSHVQLFSWTPLFRYPQLGLISDVGALNA